MRFLRPPRKVVDGGGQEWEIHVSRVGRGKPGRELLARIRLSPGRPLESASQPLKIEAVSYFPTQQRYLWTTTSDHVIPVVEQIASGLEAGELARPLGAVYRGSAASAERSRRARRRSPGL
jgi:hypothetical protein